MRQRLAAILLLAAVPLITAAQTRTLPADAKRGVVRHIEEMRVRLDGRVELLAAGAQIRDASNRIVVPVSLATDTVVKYRRDGDGRLYQLWVLTPQEAAQNPEKKQ